MKQWQLKTPPEEEIKKLIRHLNLSPLLTHLLINRGLKDPDTAHDFLFCSLKDLPNPFLLKDMDRAVDRILQAMDKGEKIVIYGDYDVDGTSATSLLILFFKEIAFPVEFYIPHRLHEGYSLNEPALKKLKNGGAQLIITVDNGISSVNGAGTAKELGIDLIITDHHEIQEKLPEAFAIINPLQKDCPYPAKNICGSGVAFNLILALRQKLRERGFFANRPEPNLKKHLDLVALATVADVVALTGVNRIFVKIGLSQIEASDKPGIKALKEVSGIDGRCKATHLGFRMGPRVNACGRLYDASTGVRLLTATDETTARRLAQELNQANQERQQIEDAILNEAKKQIEADPKREERMSYVLHHDSWHTGVVGIVASRIASMYYRPAVVLGGTAPLKGSGRSYGGLHLVEALSECRGTLLQCGGHKMAAGLSLSREMLDDFRQAFEQSVRKRITIKDCLPILTIDAELSPDQISFGVVDEINRLAPFGEGNPEPIFCLQSITPVSTRVIKDQHVKFHLEGKGYRVQAMAFNQHQSFLNASPPFDLAFTCGTNSYQGREDLLLSIKDLRASNESITH